MASRKSVVIEDQPSFMKRMVELFGYWWAFSKSALGYALKFVMYPFTVLAAMYTGIIATSPAFFGITFVASSTVAGVNFALMVTAVLSIAAGIYVAYKRDHDEKTVIRGRSSRAFKSGN